METGLNDFEKSLKIMLSTERPRFAPDERDLLARLAKARKPSRFWSLAAAASGATLALGLALSMPGPEAGVEVSGFEDELIESFGSALTGESLMSWDEWIVPENDVP